MKILHTSDWHIGRQFHNQSLLADQAYALEQICQYIEQQGIDVVIVAGDIYDRAIAPAAAVELLDKTLQTICITLNTPVIMISGNHDGATRLGFGAEHLKNAGLHIITDMEQMTKPVQIKKDDQTFDFYGIPYSDPETVRHDFSNLIEEENLEIKSYQQAHELLVNQIHQIKNPENKNVVISHCFISGGSVSESERPLSIGGADQVDARLFSDFDYTALGHLHQPQYKLQENIRYSGSLLKYSFQEQKQQKGFTVIEFNQGEQSYEHVEITTLRDMRIIEGDLLDILNKGAFDPHYQDYVMVRLLDRHAILDAMSKLRAVYPNILHLEKKGLSVDKVDSSTANHLKRNELDLFNDFFTQVSGNALSDEQKIYMKQCIDGLIKPTDEDCP